MFDFVHERKRLVQIVLAIIILPFALWGLDSYQNSGDADALATVNGARIGQPEFEDALTRQRQRLREALGENMDPSMLDGVEMKRSVLQGLVTQRVLLEEAREVGLVVSDEQVARLIAGVPAFQKEGQFDKPTYESVLRAQGMNPALFEYRVRQDVLMRQLTDALTQNGYAANASAENLIRLNEQQRVVAVSRFALDAFRSKVSVSDGEINAYYEANRHRFQMPERARVEYVTLSVAGLASRTTVAEGEVEQYYREHASEFGTEEQRQASHILIAVAKGAAETEREAARRKAGDILQQVKSKPEAFAALAGKYSEDPGSAAKGGDLGMFARGMMVKPFEDVVFSLKAGETSELVQTDFGFHIIRLTGIQPGKVRPLSEVQAQILEKLVQQRASDRFAELAEQFSNTVYEQSDSLKPAGELVGSKVLGPVWLARDQQPSGMWNDKLLQAVFSEDAVKNKRNTSAIEVDQNTLVAARVTEYQPAAALPLSEVTGQIRRALLDQAALQAASKEGAATLAQLQGGERVALKWGKTQSVSRSQQNDLNPELSRLVFAAGVDKLPAYVAVQDAQQGYLIARIEAVKDVVAIDQQKREGYVREIGRMTGDALLQAYLEDAKGRADITVRDFQDKDKL